MAADRTPVGRRIESLLEHREWVERTARALVYGDADAEDLAQQAWAEILDRPPERVPESPRGWLRRVLKHRAVDLLRGERARRGRERKAARPERIDSGAPDDLVSRAELLERVLRAVRTLEEPFRSAVLLRYVEALDVREIADRTGVAEATVRTRIHRGLDRVRGVLDAGAGGDRRVWALLLLPLVRSGTPGGTGPARAPASPAWPAALERGIAMAVNAKAALMATGVLVLLGVFLFAWRDGKGPREAVPATVASRGDGAAPSRTADPRVTTPPAEEAADSREFDADLADRPRGTLRGMVVEEGTSAPVAGLEVRARQSRGTVPEGMTATPPAPGEVRARTDGQGRFAFEALPRGAWEVEATDPDRGGAREIGIVGVDPPWLRLVLRKGFGEGPSLRVRLVGEKGEPREGVRVEGVAGRDSPFAAGVTDPEGRVVLAGIPAGSFLIRATSGSTAVLAAATGIVGRIHVRDLREEAAPVQEVVPGGEAVLTLRECGALSGRVLAPAGTEVEGAVVRAWALTFERHGMGTTGIHRDARVDAEGAYRFGDLPPGRYTLLVEHPQGLRVPAPVARDDTPWDHKGPPYLDLPRVDIGPGEQVERYLPLEPGATLRGRVERDPGGEPVAGARVEVHLPLGPFDYPEQVKVAGVPYWRLDAGPWTDDRRNPASFRVLRTGPDGRYEARGLPPAEGWRVRVVPEGSASFDLREPVTLREGETTDLLHRVVEGGTLEALLPPSSSFALRLAGEDSARAAFLTPNGNGAVRIPNLAAGEWVLLESIRVKEESLVPRGKFVIRPGETTFLDLPGAGLSTVDLKFLRRGLPVEGVEVSLLHGRGLQYSGADGTVRVQEYVGSGPFHSPDRTAMLLRFRAPGEDATNLSCYAPVEGPGGDAPWEARVEIPVGRLVFRARDPHGRPLPGVRVQPHRQFRGTPHPQEMHTEFRAKETGPDGVLVVGTLPEGTYRWTADYPDGSRRTGEAQLEGEAALEVSLAAEETGSLRVTVLLPDGRPAEGARVGATALRAEDDPGEGDPERWKKAVAVPVRGVTNGDGVLVVGGIPPGLVRVWAMPPGTPTGWGFAGDRGPAPEPVETSAFAGGETPVTVRVTEER